MDLPDLVASTVDLPHARAAAPVSRDPPSYEMSTSDVDRARAVQFSKQKPFDSRALPASLFGHDRTELPQFGAFSASTFGSGVSAGLSHDFAQAVSAASDAGGHSFSNLPMGSRLASTHSEPARSAFGDNWAGRGSGGMIAGLDARSRFGTGSAAREAQSQGGGSGFALETGRGFGNGGGFGGLESGFDSGGSGSTGLAGFSAGGGAGGSSMAMDSGGDDDNPFSMRHSQFR